MRGKEGGREEYVPITVSTVEGAAQKSLSLVYRYLKALPRFSPVLVCMWGFPQRSAGSSWQWLLCRRGSEGWRWRGGRGRSGLPAVAPPVTEPAPARVQSGPAVREREGN